MDSPCTTEPALEDSQPGQWTPFEGKFEHGELMPELESIGVRKAAVFDDQSLSLMLLQQKLSALGVQVVFGPKIKDPYRGDGVDIRPAFDKFRDLLRTSPEKLLVICDAFLVQLARSGEGTTFGFHRDVLSGIPINEIIETLREAERFGHITILTSCLDLRALQHRVEQEQIAPDEEATGEDRPFQNYDDVWAMLMPKNHDYTPDGVRAGIISGIDRRKILDRKGTAGARHGQQLGSSLRENLACMRRNVANILDSKHRA